MLAYHYSRSINLEKAIHYLNMSGQKAESKYSHIEAHGYYKDAIDLIDKLPQVEENKKRKLELLKLMMFPIIYLGQREEDFWVYEEAEKLSKELGDNKYHRRAISQIANYHSHRGNPELSLEYSKSAFEDASRIEDIELMVPLAWNLGLAYLPMGEYCKVVEIIPRVVDFIEKEKREYDGFESDFINPYATLCTMCGLGMAGMGLFERGKRYFNKALYISSDIGELGGLATAEMGYGLLSNLQGSWEDSIKHGKKAVKYSKEIKYYWFLGLSNVLLGYAYSMLGNRENAIKHAENGLDIYLNSGVESHLALIYYFSGLIYLELCEPKKALKFLEDAFNLSEKNNEKAVMGRTCIAYGRLLVKTESMEIEKAEKKLLSGIKMIQSLQMKPDFALGHFFLAELYMKAGNENKMTLNLKKAHGMFKELNMDYWLKRTQKFMKESKVR